MGKKNNPPIRVVNARRGSARTREIVPYSLYGDKKTTALFGIPLTALAGIGGLALYWYLEHPERHMNLQQQQRQRRVAEKEKAVEEEEKMEEKKEDEDEKEEEEEEEKAVYTVEEVEEVEEEEEEIKRAGEGKAGAAAVDDHRHHRHEQRRRLYRRLHFFRHRLRRALEGVGFFHNFGFICGSAVAFELACAAAIIAKKGVAYEFLRGHTTPFKLLVAYVASNHLLFGVHTVLVGLYKLSSVDP
jgi:hypothetical protein